MNSRNKVGRPVERKTEKGQASPGGATAVATNNAADASVAMIRSKVPDKDPTRKDREAAAAEKAKQNDKRGEKSTRKRTQQVTKKKPEKEAKARVKKKSILGKCLLQFGLNFTNVILRDPRAIEAAQALNLQPWHLRKLKVKFDLIDIDGSGAIDQDEFFEACLLYTSDAADE